MATSTITSSHPPSGHLYRVMHLNWLQLMAILLAVLLLNLWATPASAQNSREAIEAVRKHRAETGSDTRANQPPAPAQSKTSKFSNPFSSGADPKADPNLNLKSCLDHVGGLNVMGRDRCFRQHCQGRWNQGQCPPGSDHTLLGNNSKPSNTPLGRCLAQAGSHPIKMTQCGWAHCKPDWSSAECQALAPAARKPGE